MDHRAGADFLKEIRLKCSFVGLLLIYFGAKAGTGHIEGKTEDLDKNRLQISRLVVLVLVFVFVVAAAAAERGTSQSTFLESSQSKRCNSLQASPSVAVRF